MSTNLDDVVDPIPDGHGAVGLLSADEFRSTAESFDRALIEATGPRVALVFAASPRGAAQSARLGTSYYRRLGADPVVVDCLLREQARADVLPDYDVLFLAGGDPGVLLACLQETPLWEEALRRWRGGRGLAGSSAGAMALCGHSLVPEPGAGRPSRWTRGLGPVERFAVAVHARSAPEKWLRQIAASAPVPVVALDEDAGLVLRPGQPLTIAGAGRAWVLDDGDAPPITRAVRG